MPVSEVAIFFRKPPQLDGAFTEMLCDKQRDESACGNQQEIEKERHANNGGKAGDRTDVRQSVADILEQSRLGLRVGFFMPLRLRNGQE